MSYKTAYNGGDTPLVVDEQGRSIGGGEWGTVSTTDDNVKTLIGEGLLVITDVDLEAEGVNPEAKAAAKRTAEIADRDATLSGLDRDDLAKIAQKAGLLEEGADVPLKSQLQAQLAHSDAAIPAKRQAAAPAKEGNK